MDKPQKPFLYQIYFILTGIEAILAFMALLRTQSGEQNAWLFGYSQPRLLIGGIMLGVAAAFAGFSFKAFSDRNWLAKTAGFLNRMAANKTAGLIFTALVFSLAVLVILTGFAIASSEVPEFILQRQTALARPTPLLLWLTLAGFQTLGLLLLTSSERLKYLSKTCLVGGLFLVLFVLYWYGAVQQLTRVNVNKNSTDQGAYMKYARRMVESGYNYPGDFNRMPVYPFIQSLFYRPGMTNDEFFIQGKYLNLLLSTLMLAGFAFIFSRYFDFLHTLDLMLIAAFTIFAFKAGWFQVELLFYFFNFCLFWFMLRFLQEPSFKIAILVGVMAGLAHLTKASILPGLVLFLLFGTIKGGCITLRMLRSGAHANTLQSARTQLLPLVLVGLFFLITVFPYIQTSKRIFGHYFYNVNSTFYIWYDTWDEATQGTRAHGDRSGWPDLPPDEIPSMSKYLREHTAIQILARIVDGSRSTFERMTDSYGYLDYIVIYTGLLLVFGAIFWKRTWRDFTRNPFLGLFLLAYFGIYFLLYSWYNPIVNGNRLILAQLIPLLFVVSIGLRNLLKDFAFEFRGKPLKVLTVINLLILAMLVVDIYFVLTDRIVTLYGGS